MEINSVTKFPIYLPLKKQSGFLLPLALFMIIVASGLALIMLRQVSQSSTTNIIRFMALTSVYAAEAGAELGANQIFFPTTTPVFDRQQMDYRCNSLAVGSSFNVSGLNQCNLTVACECRYENNALCDTSNNNNYNGSLGIDYSFYRIISEARCGSDFAEGYYRFELNKKAP